MDWNHDGKHDWQDHAFYNNVVSEDAQKNSTSSGRNGSTQKQPTYIKDKVTKEEEKTAQIIIWIIIGIFLFFKLVIGD